MSSLGGPHIVTDGLVLSLDAANVKSYQSGSSIWYDKSGYANNGTLVNGPTFNSQNGGSIVFDGVNDYVTLNNQSAFLTPPTFSVDVWFNSSNTNLEQVLWGNTPPYSAGYVVGIYLSKLLFQGYSSTQMVGIGNTIYNDTWYHMVFTYNNGASAFYLNGKLSSSVPGTTIFTTPAGPTIIGRYTNNSGHFLGKIPTVKYYNRVLSIQEVIQNYNATKSRFNL